MQKGGAALKRAELYPCQIQRKKIILAIVSGNYNLRESIQIPDEPVIGQSKNLILWDKAVALAMGGNDMLGRVWLDFDFLAQFRNVVVDCARGRDVVIPPHLF